MDGMQKKQKLKWAHKFPIFEGQSRLRSFRFETRADEKELLKDSHGAAGLSSSSSSISQPTERLQFSNSDAKMIRLDDVDDDDSEVDSVSDSADDSSAANIPERFSDTARPHRPTHWSIPRNSYYQSFSGTNEVNMIDFDAIKRKSRIKSAGKLDKPSIKTGQQWFMKTLLFPFFVYWWKSKLKGQWLAIGLFLYFLHCVSLLAYFSLERNQRDKFLHLEVSFPMLLLLVDAGLLGHCAAVSSVIHRALQAEEENRVHEESDSVKTTSVKHPKHSRSKSSGTGFRRSAVGYENDLFFEYRPALTRHGDIRSEGRLNRGPASSGRGVRGSDISVAESLKGSHLSTDYGYFSSDDDADESDFCSKHLQPPPSISRNRSAADLRRNRSLFFHHNRWSEVDIRNSQSERMERAASLPSFESSFDFQRSIQDPSKINSYYRQQEHKLWSEYWSRENIRAESLLFLSLHRNEELSVQEVRDAIYSRINAARPNLTNFILARVSAILIGLTTIILRFVLRWEAIFCWLSSKGFGFDLVTSMLGSVSDDELTDSASQGGEGFVSSLCKWTTSENENRQCNLDTDVQALALIFPSWKHFFIAVSSSLCSFWLAAIFFQFAAMAEDAFRRRLFYAKYFSRVTSARGAQTMSIPHFRLNKVNHIRVWLELRSDPRELHNSTYRFGDAAANFLVVATVSAVTVVCIMLFCGIWDAEDPSDVLLLVCAICLSVFMYRFVKLAERTRKKYDTTKILYTERLNLYLKICSSTGEREELIACNNMLKICSKLIRELEKNKEKYKVLLLNPFVYNILRVTILSAIGTMSSEFLGFKVRLWKL